MLWPAKICTQLCVFSFSESDRVSTVLAVGPGRRRPI